MKKIKFSICYLLFIICATNAFAQTYVPFNYSPKFIGSEIVTGSFAVGQTISADASAVAELESTTKGFLLPRMTQAQREAIASPATGLMVYQTDGTEGFYSYSGASWGSVGLATPVSVANGGTGISSYAVGDIIYASGATTLSKLPIGTANQQLRVNAGATALEYFTPASSGITVGSTTITSGTTLRVPYNNAGVYSEQANFTIGSVATGYLDVPTGYAIGGFNFAKQTYNAGVLEQMAIGYLAGVSMDVSYYQTGQNLYVGIKAGRYSAGQYTSNNTVVGNNAFSHASLYGQNNGNNTLIGYSAASGWTGGCDNNTIVGNAIGTSAGSTIRQATYIGGSIPTMYSNSGAFGYGASPTAPNQLVFGNAAAAAGTGVFDNVYFNGVTFTSPAAVNLRNAGESGTDQSTTTGITIIPSLGTGTGNSAPFKVQSGVPTTTGTTQATPGDRLAVLGNYVALTEATATAFARVNIPSNSVAGGSVNVTVQANDGTEFQARTLEFAWSATNKAGTTDADISTPIEVVSISSGTLTVTITAVDAGSGNIDFKADATSSLTQTTLNAVCQVQKNFGTGSITQ